MAQGHIETKFRLGAKLWNFRLGRREVVWGPWRNFNSDTSMRRGCGLYLEVLTAYSPDLDEYIEVWCDRRSRKVAS